MTALQIREVTQEDRDIWFLMYRALFGTFRDAALHKEIDRIYADPSATAYIAWQCPKAVGFAEYSVRPFANGCHSKPVPFLEGIWVDPEYRNQGIGAALIAHIEAVARAAGHWELGSDVDIGNAASLKAHENWGFEETERVVYFRKSL